MKAFTVGSIFHAAMERYQLAGEDGIVPTPEKVAQWSDGDAFDSAGPPGTRSRQACADVPALVQQAPGPRRLVERARDPKDTLNVVSMVNGVIDWGLAPHFPEEGAWSSAWSWSPWPTGLLPIVRRPWLGHGGEGRDQEVAAPKWALKPKELQTNPQLLTGYWMLRERSARA